MSHLDGFDSIRAFRGALDGKVRLFRPELHIQRLAASLRYNEVPEMSKSDEEAFLECIKRFVRFEAEHGRVPRKLRNDNDDAAGKGLGGPASSLSTLEKKGEGFVFSQRPLPMSDR